MLLTRQSALMVAESARGDVFEREQSNRSLELGVLSLVISTCDVASLLVEIVSHQST